MDPAALAWAQQAPRDAANVLLTFHRKSRVRGPRGDRPQIDAAEFSSPARLVTLSGDEIPGEFRTETRQLWRASVSPPGGESIDRAMVAQGGGKAYEILSVAEGSGRVGIALVLAEVSVQVVAAIPVVPLPETGLPGIIPISVGG